MSAAIIATAFLLALIPYPLAYLKYRRNRLATNIQRYYRGMQARRNVREYRSLRYWNWVRSPNFIGPTDDYIRPLDFFLGSRNQFRSGIREVDTDPTGTVQFTDPEPTGLNRVFRRFKRP